MIWLYNDYDLHSKKTTLDNARRALEEIIAEIRNAEKAKKDAELKAQKIKREEEAKAKKEAETKAKSEADAKAKKEEEVNNSNKGESSEMDIE